MNPNPSQTASFLDSFLPSAWRQTPAPKTETAPTSGLEFTRLVEVLASPSGDRNRLSSLGLTQAALWGDTVVFWGQTLATTAIYCADWHAVKTAVSAHQSVPGGSAPIAHFGAAPAFDGPTKVLFCGQTQVGQNAIFQADLTAGADAAGAVEGGQAVKPLLLTEQPILANDDGFINFSNPSVQAGKIAFLGRLMSDQQKGIFSYVDGALQMITRQSGADCPTPFADLGRPAIDGETGHVVFRAHDSHYQMGLYHSVDGELSPFATAQTSIPDGIGTFTSFGDPLVASGQVIFCGRGNVFQQGLYRLTADGLEALVNTQTRIPDSLETFARFHAFSVEGEAVAFLAGDSHGHLGLFILRKDELIKVIGVGDILEDKPIRNLMLGHYGLHGQGLAFRVRFVDGSEGIYRVDWGK
ncbi:MAG: hypothetical protein AAF152_18570 [Cyanobacteria bacterium P01_A01_bin.114]